MSFQSLSLSGIENKKEFLRNQHKKINSFDNKKNNHLIITGMILCNNNINLPKKKKIIRLEKSNILERISNVDNKQRLHDLKFLLSSEDKTNDLKDDFVYGNKSTFHSNRINDNLSKLFTVQPHPKKHKPEEKKIYSRKKNLKLPFPERFFLQNYAFIKNKKEENEAIQTIEKLDKKMNSELNMIKKAIGEDFDDLFLVDDY